MPLPLGKVTKLVTKVSYQPDDLSRIFAPKMIKGNDNIWREDSDFFRSKVNFHAEIVAFGAKIKIGEKLRISEQ